MPSLEPGQRVETPPSDRLRVKLDGAGASSAIVQVDGDGVLTGRTKQGNAAGPDVVVEASGPGSATLVVSSATADSPILGRITMQVVAIPASDAQPHPKKREWTVSALQLEGRTSVAVLRVNVDQRKVWSIESLLEGAHDGDDEDERRARITWGDRERIDASISVLVDRSASMAWAYQPAGVLACIHRGVHAAATAATSGRGSVAWFTFGSAAEKKSERVRLARIEDADDAVLALKPELFSSGSRLDPELLDQLNVEQGIVVTDSCLAAPELLAARNAGRVASLIVVGDANDDELITAEDRQARSELAEAGLGVLLLPVEATASGVDADRWIDLVTEFVMGRIAAQQVTEPEDAHAAEE